MAPPYRRRERAPRLVHLFVVLAALARLLSAPVSQASEAPRVVMVTAGALPASGERVRAELAAMGFAIVLDEGSSKEPTRDALADVARARDAVAAVALTFSPDGIELWVVDRRKQETRLRSFVSAEHADTDPTLALRTAELLRATLLAVAAERTAAAPAPPPELPARQMPEPPLGTAVAPSAAGDVVAPAPSAAALDPGASRALALRLGAGLVWSAGGLGTFPSLQLAAKWWLSEHLGAELAALLPLAGMSQHSPEGSSTTHVGALSLAIVASLPLGNGVWVWDIGAGVAGVALQTQGTPASMGYTREESVGVSVAPLLRTALWYSLTRRSRLGLGASLGVSVPRFLIVHVDTTVAKWGLPFALGELSFELDVL